MTIFDVFVSFFLDVFQNANGIQKKTIFELILIPVRSKLRFTKEEAGVRKYCVSLRKRAFENIPLLPTFDVVSEVIDFSGEHKSKKKTFLGPKGQHPAGCAMFYSTKLATKTKEKDNSDISSYYDYIVDTVEL